jgi:hypothetical protein
LGKNAGLAAAFSRYGMAGQMPRRRAASRLALEPLRKVVESMESVVIRYVVSKHGGDTTCGSRNTDGQRIARLFAIPAI